MLLLVLPDNAPEHEQEESWFVVTDELPKMISWQHRHRHNNGWIQVIHWMRGVIFLVE
jgi:hypothetical protein